MMNDINYHIINVWDYLTVQDRICPSDAIFALGRDDYAIPETALQLYKNNYAPFIVLVGGYGRLSGNLRIPESIAFLNYLLGHGIPKTKLIYETKSTNTFENIKYGFEALKEKTYKVNSIIIVTHGPHSRRAIASANYNNRNISYLSCPDSCPIHLLDSPDVLSTVYELIGEVERLIEYSKLGYIQNTVVPVSIIESIEQLKSWINRTTLLLEKV